MPIQDILDNHPIEKITSFNDYTDAATRTLAHHFHVTMPFEFLHASIGINTEIIEMFEAFEKGQETFDRTNFAEEIGDCLWYLAIAWKYSDLPADPFDSWFKKDKLFAKVNGIDISIGREIATELLIASGNILDVCKKSIYYNKDRDKINVRDLLCQVSSSLLLLADWLGINISDIATANIQKLKNRFPEKYSDYKASNRNLESERETLDKHFNE